MQYYYGAEDIKLQNTCIAIGKFDGLHIGHRKLINILNSYSSDELTSVILTFDFNPANLFSEKETAYIYSRHEKLRLLEQTGVDIVISYPFTRDTAAMTAEDFVRDVLIDGFGMKALIVGADFRLGRDRMGDVGYLDALSKKYKFDLVVCDKESFSGEHVSSTRLRNLLAEGDVEQANKMLGMPYFIMGEVKHGRGIGHKLTVPTVNIRPDSQKVLLPNGVYVTETLIADNKYRSVTNIGVNPTVNTDKEHEISIETYIFDYDGDLYDSELVVEFFHYIRRERKFKDSDELKEQIIRDIEFSRNFTLQK